MMARPVIGTDAQGMSETSLAAIGALVIGAAISAIVTAAAYVITASLWWAVLPAAVLYCLAVSFLLPLAGRAARLLPVFAIATFSAIAAGIAAGALLRLRFF